MQSTTIQLVIPIQISKFKLGNTWLDQSPVRSNLGVTVDLRLHMSPYKIGKNDWKSRKYNPWY